MQSIWEVGGGEGMQSIWEVGGGEGMQSIWEVGGGEGDCCSIPLASVFSSAVMSLLSLLVISSQLLLRRQIPCSSTCIGCVYSAQRDR